MSGEFVFTFAAFNAKLFVFSFAVFYAKLFGKFFGMFVSDGVVFGMSVVMVVMVGLHCSELH